MCYDKMVNVSTKDYMSKKNTVYLSSYSPLNEGQVSILTNLMIRTYTSDIDERKILR